MMYSSALRLNENWFSSDFWNLYTVGLVFVNPMPLRSYSTASWLALITGLSRGLVIVTVRHFSSDGELQILEKGMLIHLIAVYLRFLLSKDSTNFSANMSRIDIYASVRSILLSSSASTRSAAPTFSGYIKVGGFCSLGAEDDVVAVCTSVGAVEGMFTLPPTI